MAAATWQGVVVLSIVLCVLMCWKRVPPLWRYSLLLVALAKFVLPLPGSDRFGLFAWTGPVEDSVTARVEAATTLPLRNVQERSMESAAEFGFIHAPALPSTVDEASETAISTIASPAEPTRIEASALTLAGWLLLIQFAGTGAFVVFVVLRIVKLRHRLRQGQRLETGPLQELAERIGRRLGLGRRPELYVCDGFLSPRAGGLFRPFVLLPAWVMDAGPAERRALIAHELAHIRRYDPLVNWLQVAAQAILWWNPLAWWLNRRIRTERELCCDDLVIGLGLVEAEPYSRVLVNVAKRMTRREVWLQAVGMAESFESLKDRILRTLDNTRCRTVRMSLVSILLLVAFAAVVLPGSPRGRGMAEDRPVTPTTTAEDGEAKQTEPPPAVAEWLGRQRLRQIDEKDELSHMLVHFAAWDGRTDVMEWLKEQGADTNAGNFVGWTPMHNAARNGHIALMEWLKEQGVKIDVKNNGGETPMNSAAMSGHIPVMEWLEKNGADVNQSTLMLSAASSGNVAALEWLKVRGADVNAKNSSGRTPMYGAAMYGHVEAMKWLKENGADVNAVSDWGNPMNLAAWHNHVEAMKWLREQGVDINMKAQNVTAYTPMHMAAERGFVEAMQLLKEWGADINAKGGGGKTPGHVAEENCRDAEGLWKANLEKAIEWLKANGAE